MDDSLFHSLLLLFSSSAVDYLSFACFLIYSFTLHGLSHYYFLSITFVFYFHCFSAASSCCCFSCSCSLLWCLVLCVLVSWFLMLLSLSCSRFYVKNQNVHREYILTRTHHEKGGEKGPRLEITSNFGRIYSIFSLCHVTVPG